LTFYLKFPIMANIIQGRVRGVEGKECGAWGKAEIEKLRRWEVK
jgi:hypothetical protein